MPWLVSWASTLFHYLSRQSVEARGISAEDRGRYAVVRGISAVVRGTPWTCPWNAVEVRGHCRGARPKDKYCASLPIWQQRAPPLTLAVCGPCPWLQGGGRGSSPCRKGKGGAPCGKALDKGGCPPPFWQGGGGSHTLWQTGAGVHLLVATESKCTRPFGQRKSPSPCGTLPHIVVKERENTPPGG